MQVVTNGTLVLAQGEMLSIFAGEAEYQFSDHPQGTIRAPQECSFSVPFGIPVGHPLVSTGQFRYGDKAYRHRLAFIGTSDPAVTIIHYTITSD